MDFLIISFSLLISGLITIVGNRDNIIKIFIGAEMCLFAASGNFVFGFGYGGNAAGLVVVFFILAVAAAEAAVGLGLAVLVFLKCGTLRLEEVQSMGG